MSDLKHERIQAIFRRVRELPVDQRAAFLEGACGHEPDVKAAVEAMLAAAPPFTPSAGFDPNAVTIDPSPQPVAPMHEAVIREGAGTRIGPYKLLQLIGEGGFGSVFMAEQEQPVRRRVALKIIKLGMDTRQVVARFEQERQALALMDHPNIARVLDAGATETGRPYFVMELVKGEPITKFCDKHRLSIPERLELCVQVCNAVQHAHHKGVIHRDIKPNNILVSMHDGRPFARVIDFGIAKATAAQLTEKTLFTEHRQFIGTPEYMSPEQAEGSLDIDTRTDVYSLGVLLYELLTGHTPFSSRELRSAAFDEIQRIIREVDPPKPSTRISQSNETLASVAASRRLEPRRLGMLIRGELDWIVMKALEKERGRRYETAVMLAQDIERYLGGEPVTAAPPGTMYRVRKFIHRNRWPVGVTAATVLILLSGVVLMSILYGIAERERHRAEMQTSIADAAAEEARKENEKTLAAFSFIKEMFSWIDPNVSKGREVTVREVLDEAAKRAETSLADKPEVEGQVRESLGEAYHFIAQYPESIANLRRSYELREKTLGPLHVETLTSLHNIGVSLIAQGRGPDAVPYLKRAVEGRRQSLGEDNAETLISMGMLAFAIQLTGDLDAAEKAIREVIAAQTRVSGATHRETIESRTSLADILQGQGRIDDALKVTEELAADCKTALGEDDVLTIQARSLLAAVLNDAGRHDEAETVIREVVEAKKRVYGPDRAETFLSEDVLASILRQQGKSDEAEAINRSVVERSKRVFGRDSETTLTYMNNLAQSLHRSKKFDEAESIYRDVVNVRRTQSPMDKNTLTSTMNLGLVLLDAGRPAEASVLLLETATGFEKILSANHWMTGASQVFAAESLTAQERFDEAEPLIIKGYDAVLAGLGPDHWRTQTVIQAAIALYEKWQKPDEAAKWRARLKSE